MSTTTITRPAFAWRTTGSRLRQRPADNANGNAADTDSRERQRPVQQVDWKRLMQAAHCFGVETFRPGQRELIEAVLQGRDALGILPTGGGKSLCYQLPALFLPKPTVIVTPLLALAQDQVDHLTKWRLESSRLDSSLSKQELRDNAREIESGISPLIYVTPERLQTEDCIALLQLNGVSRLVIDEAHCVSDWGHDFRPAYLAIARAAERLGNPPILATTATATAETASDIVDQLGMRDPVVVRPGLHRPNLTFEVFRTLNDDRKRAALQSILAREQGSGIIYCATIAQAEEVHAWLAARCASAGLYHGQLRISTREQTQQRFMDGDLRIMVATKAFGLGIDKRDVRFVVHWSFPDSLETYYQEAGRAGRDGQPARAYLLYRLEDRRIQTYFLGTKYPSPDECQRLCTALAPAAASVSARSPLTIDALAKATNTPERHLRVLFHHLERESLATIQDDEIVLRDPNPRSLPRALAAIIAKYTKRRTRDRARLAAMMHYAQSTDCRAAHVLHYFGEPAQDCAHCDTCRTRGRS